MITGEIKREKREQAIVEYRKIDALNQSSIALFDSSPLQFYKEIILKEPRKEKDSKSFPLGNLLDFFTLECNGDEELFNQNFDDKFSLFDGTKGSGQAFLLADKLFSITKRDRNEEGIITTDATERFKEAFEYIQLQEKYKGKTWEKALEDFTEGKAAKEYLDSLLANIDKEIVDLITLEKAKFLNNQLLTDGFTKSIFTDNSGIEVLNKFAIEWEYLHPIYGKMQCKSEIDRIHIDDTKKEIYIYDLKSAYDNEGFEYSYIKWYYYLQNAFYFLAIQYMAENGNMKDYTIHPIQFIVADTSSNKRRPLIYETTMQHIKEGLNGFVLNGKKYRGIHELVGEIMWADANGIWNCSFENFNNGGIVKLPTFDEKK